MGCQYCGLEVRFNGVPYPDDRYSQPMGYNHAQQSECFDALRQELQHLRSEAQNQRSRAERLADENLIGRNTVEVARTEVSKLKSLNAKLRIENAYNIERKNFLASVIWESLVYVQDKIKNMPEAAIPPYEQWLSIRRTIDRGVARFRKESPKECEELEKNEPQAK